MRILPLFLVAATVVATISPDRTAAQAASSRYLNLLPDGEEKRKFILDCTGCHQFDATITDFDGKRKSAQHWLARTGQMVQYFGGDGVFPIMSPSRNAEETTRWLVAHLGDSVAPAPFGELDFEYSDDVEMTEFAIPEPRDLPHDLMVDAAGQVVITGMMTHRMYVLDPGSGEFEITPIPVEKANPRALDIDGDGNWWVLLGSPGMVARYDPGSREWQSWEIGTYPHSIVRDTGGGIWFNGHFSKDPEIIGYLDPSTGEVTTVEVPVSAMDDGGSNIPYGLRMAPDRSIWMTELVGNRLIHYAPDSGDFDVYDLPTTFSGPRRPDIAPDGTVWIPEYSNNRIARFDPVAETFEEFELPIDDSLPYIVRVHPVTGDIWVATAAADVVYRFTPGSTSFATYRVPTHSALMRHMEMDRATGDVWIAYGNSPAVSPKVLRISSKK